MAGNRWRKFWVWDAFPNLLTSTLGGATAAPTPFAQNDWPNPRAPVQPQENRGFVRSTNVQLIGQDKFFGAAGQTQTYDYPNPLLARRLPQADCQSSLLVGPLARPFAQSDWPNPLAALQPQENRGFTRPANVQLIGQDKFFGATGQAPFYDYPNPLRPRYSVQPEPFPDLLTTVFSVVVFPFVLTDWPNPREPKQPQENRGFLHSADTRLIGLDKFFGAPGEAPTYDYPSPQRPRQPVQPEPPLNFAILHTAIAAPFYQTDWPNPPKAKQPQENQGFTRAANVQLIGKDQFFYAPGEAPVYDWPNPLRPRYPVQPEPPLVTPFIPPAPPSNLIPDFVFVEPTRNLVFSLIAAPYPPLTSSLMPGVGQLGIDTSGNGEQVVAAWDAKNLPEILAGGTLLSSPAPTIQSEVAPNQPAGQPPLTFSSIQVNGTQIQAIVSVTGGTAAIKYLTLAKVYINNASTWRYIYGDIVLIGPS